MSVSSLLVSKLPKLLIAGLFIIVLLWLLWETEEVDKAEIAVPTLLKVSTLLAQPQHHTVSVEVIGTTQPRWPLQVVSAVEGRVKQLPENLEPGKLISGESLLLEIEPSAYAAAVASAQASIDQAELELARIKHEKTVVEQISNNKKLSEFGRFIPHLALAEANLSAAKESYHNAQQRLAETLIVAPFPAIVLNRSVVPGQWVNVGDVLFSLAASESIDISAELSGVQLNKLGNIDNGASATITDQAGGSWQARLRFVAPDFSQQTRQKRVVFYVENPFSSNKKLSPNASISLTIKGRELPNVFVLPSSVLTPDGEVWQVEDGKLTKIPVTIEQEYQNSVYVRFENGLQNNAGNTNASREIVRFPLSTMLNGQSVLTQPVEVTAFGETALGESE